MYAAGTTTSMGKRAFVSRDHYYENVHIVGNQGSNLLFISIELESEPIFER
jgi:hypothetical protein